MIRWTFYYKDQKDLAKQLALTALGILLFFCGSFRHNLDRSVDFWLKKPEAITPPLFLSASSASAATHSLLLGVYTLLVAVLAVYFIDRALVSRRKRKGLPYRHLPRPLHDPWGKLYRALNSN